MFDASTASVAPRTLPPKTLAKGQLEITDVKEAKSGNLYLAIKVHLEGDYEGSQILSRIMLTEEGGSRPSKRGLASIRAILESNGFDPAKDVRPFQFKDSAEIVDRLNGRKCAVKTGVTEDGWNDVKMFLSPLSTPKDWEAFKSGSQAPVPSTSMGFDTASSRARAASVAAYMPRSTVAPAPRTIPTTSPRTGAGSPVTSAPTPATSPPCIRFTVPTPSLPTGPGREAARRAPMPS